MIRLSRLNKEAFLVNCDLIEYVEETPDTVISMASGRKLVVLESADEIRKRVIGFKKQIFGADPVEGAEKQG